MQPVNQLGQVPYELESLFQMKKEEVERELAPYFYQYFQQCFSSPKSVRNYYQFCQHIYDITQAKGKKILDVGCGFGLISICLAALHAYKVAGIDHNKEKISVFEKILSRYSPQLPNIEARLGDVLSMPYPDRSFNVVVANEVISHVRDFDAFLFELSRVLAPGGILYIQDGDNALNIFQWHHRHQVWRKAEYGPIDEASLRGTDKRLPWVLIRREMIKEKFPELEPTVLDLLAKETAGLYGNQMFRAVEEYLKAGQIIYKPKFKYRNPETGEYPEFDFNPFRLKNRLEEVGFIATVLKPYFPDYPLMPNRGILLNVAVWLASKVIRTLHPASIIIAPRFEILARKVS